MANTIVTPQWTLREVTRMFENSVQFIKNVNRELSDQYVQAGAKVGNTVNARLPQRFTPSHGQALSVQALYDRTVPVTLNDQVHIDWAFSSAEATTEIQDVQKRFVEPAAATLANDCDKAAFNNLYASVYNVIGSPGAAPTTNAAYLQAGIKLSDGSTSVDGRVAVLDLQAMATLAAQNLTLFNPSGKIGDAFEKGMFATDALGFQKWYQTQNAPAHTTGSFTACTPTVNGANQTGATLNTQAWASGATTLNKGDTFTLAGVYSWNPLSQKSTGRLQQFVVTATTSDSSGNMTALPISPSIITSGALQTVSGSPSTGAAITVWAANPTNGTLTATVTPQSMMFLPDAFAWVSADLDKPQGGADSEIVRSKQFGVSIRMVRQFQIGTDQNVARLDILKGEAAIRPEFACRVAG